MSHPVCAVCKKSDSGQVHHIEGRIGERLNDTSRWLAVCMSCHQRINDHGGWARENGFLR